MLERCMHCQLNTAGHHEWDCPLNPSKFNASDKITLTPPTWTGGPNFYMGSDKCHKCGTLLGYSPLIDWGKLAGTFYIVARDWCPKCHPIETCPTCGHKKIKEEGE